MALAGALTSGARARAPRGSLEVRLADPEAMPEVTRGVSRELAMPAGAFEGTDLGG